MFRKMVVFFVVSICLFCVFFATLGANFQTFSKAQKLSVVIDAGHGGIDSGCEGSFLKLKESDVNLAVAKKLGNLFQNAGFKVIYTRVSDEGLYGAIQKGFKERDLQNRVKIINESNCDILISVHMNKYSAEYRRGAQVFYSKEQELNQKLALSIQKNLNSMEEAKRECDILVGDYYLLNYSKIPSVIVECGFLSNKEEEYLLSSSKYQEEIAYAIFLGSVEYFSQNVNYSFENLDYGF